MTADPGAREAAAQPDWVDCEHHWVSKHQPDFPDGIYWVRVCSFCDRIDGSDLAGQLADALAAAGLLAAPAGDGPPPQMVDMLATRDRAPSVRDAEGGQ